MFVAGTGDTDHQLRPFFAEIDPFGILHHDDSRTPDARLRLGRPVGNGNTHAQIGRGHTLAGDHRLGVFPVDITAGSQQRSGGTDRLLLAHRRQSGTDPLQGQHLRRRCSGVAAAGTSLRLRSFGCSGLALDPAVQHVEGRIGEELPITITSDAGAAFPARCDNCDWHTTTSVPSGIVSTELLVTRTPLPSGSMRLRKRVAPMALDPMPASQAKTTVRIGPSSARGARLVPPITVPLGF